MIVVLFSAVAGLLIDEKKRELADDILLNGITFGRLTAPTIAQIYDQYLSEGGFVYFNREMQSFFNQNDDVYRIDFVTFSGEYLYRSDEDTERKYEGKARLVSDDMLLEQIRSENVSYKTENWDEYYLKLTEDNEYVTVDKNEKPIEPPKSGTKIQYIVVPASERYAAIYYISYDNLDARIDSMVERIVYLAVFGVLLGILLSIFVSGSMTRNIGKLVDSAEKVAKGDLSTRVKIRSYDEIGFLGKTFNKMTQDLEASMAARVYKERVARELELAKQIQDSLVPKDENIPLTDDIEIAARLIPAEEIGGDMYDFLDFDKDRLLMYLGDVTGHGVPAGIVGSIASALFFGYSTQSDLKQIMLAVNNVLKVKTMTNMFMTLVLMEWDKLNRRFRYVSAGHEQILHYRAATADVVLEPAGGIALGMLPKIEAHMKVSEVDFQVGDYLVIYSDGIPEAWKNEKENYSDY